MGLRAQESHAGDKGRQQGLQLCPPSLGSTTARASGPRLCPQRPVPDGPGGKRRGLKVTRLQPLPSYWRPAPE